MGKEECILTEGSENCPFHVSGERGIQTTALICHMKHEGITQGKEILEHSQAFENATIHLEQQIIGHVIK